MKLHRTVIASGLVWVAAATMVSIAMAGASARAETRAELDSVVVDHVDDLLADRYDTAWARIHPVDRRAVGRELWELCKQSSGGSLTEIQYVNVGVVRARSAKFSSRLHKHIGSMAVTVEVRALLSGLPIHVRDVSHWILANGRWYRLIEQRKLAAYARSRCPA